MCVSEVEPGKCSGQLIRLVINDPTLGTTNDVTLMFDTKLLSRIL